MSREVLTLVADDVAAPLYLTAAQVGRLLQVSEKSVYRWMKTDASMPALRIGGTVRFPRERLERWLRSMEQGQPRIRRPLRPLANAASDEEPGDA